MKNLAATADRIAQKLSKHGEKYLRLGCDFEALREYCDFETGSDLDCVPLDLLTDMVSARLKALA